MRKRTEIEMIYELNKLYAERKKEFDEGWENRNYESPLFDKIDEVEEEIDHGDLKIRKKEKQLLKSMVTLLVDHNLLKIYGINVMNHIVSYI